MFRILVLMVWMAVSCMAYPDGYVLEVTHSCGNTSTYATITIKSDFHVHAKLKCFGGAQNMDPINNTVFESSVHVFYNRSDSGCKFQHPNDNSSLYAIELEVAYGFGNDSLLDEYKTYTITCTAEDHGADLLDSQEIDDELVPLIDLTKQIGSNYNGVIRVSLIDILGDEITGNRLAMSKKVYLRVQVENGTAVGLTPYNCYAISSDEKNRYDLLVAGCGDGVIIPRNVGFSTSGKVATSPMFRVFNLRSFSNSDKAVSFSCSVTTCSGACDGDSCALRQKRSADERGNEVLIHTPQFEVFGLPDTTGENSDLDLNDLDLGLKQEAEHMASVAKLIAEILSAKSNLDLKINEMVNMVIGSVAVVALLLAVVALIRSTKR